MEKSDRELFARSISYDGKPKKHLIYLKNALVERKAWAVGSNTLEIQGCSICIIYNFIQFLSEMIQEEYQCTDKKVATPYNTALSSKVGGHACDKNPDTVGKKLHAIGAIV